MGTPAAIKRKIQEAIVLAKREAPSVVPALQSADLVQRKAALEDTQAETWLLGKVTALVNDLRTAGWNDEQIAAGLEELQAPT